jgi:hypothetical protein
MQEAEGNKHFLVGGSLDWRRYILTMGVEKEKDVER